METTKLNSGHFMPRVGFGTSKVLGAELVHSMLDAALGAGYRSFDTAAVYDNEKEIGAAFKDLLKKHDLKREDIFITTKLSPEDQGNARSAALNSMSALQTDYLDLYLIHWPGSRGKGDDAKDDDLRKSSWLEMEQLVKEGKLKSIGVSNYMINHLEELLTYCSIKPALNQVEHHPHLNQVDLMKFCQGHGIHYQAYSSLGGPRSNGVLLEEPIVKKIASDHSKTPAQILLRWAIQQDIGVLPRTTNPERVRQNIQVFDFNLSSEDMSAINSLHKDLRYCFDPRTVR